MDSMTARLRAPPSPPQKKRVLFREVLACVLRNPLAQHTKRARFIPRSPDYYGGRAPIAASLYQSGEQCLPGDKQSIDEQGAADALLVFPAGRGRAGTRLERIAEIAARARTHTI